jgi:hypothetical protein
VAHVPAHEEGGGGTDWIAHDEGGPYGERDSGADAVSVGFRCLVCTFNPTVPRVVATTRSLAGNHAKVKRAGLGWGSVLKEWARTRSK